MNKVVINLDSTGLANSACSYKYHKVCIEGYRQPPLPSAIYGIAVHKFVQTMFKTDGNWPLAREAALKIFKLPKQQPPKTKPWLVDDKHLAATCFNLWNDRIAEDKSFDRLVWEQPCWWCKGTGKLTNSIPTSIPPSEPFNKCSHCDGKGSFPQPAVEVSFRIKFFEDDYIEVWLTGTMDEFVKIQNGIHAIGDWKCTTFWEVDKYLAGYALSRQLRIYTLAIKKMQTINPNFLPGVKTIGAFIDGVFVKSKPNENEYKRSDMFVFSEDDLANFETMLITFCQNLSSNVKSNYFPREGIINGTCDGKFGYPCMFWDVCRNNDKVGNLLLGRDYKKVPYDPLNFNPEEE